MHADRVYGQPIHIDINCGLALRILYMHIYVGRYVCVYI